MPSSLDALLEARLALADLTDRVVDRFERELLAAYLRAGQTLARVAQAVAQGQTGATITAARAGQLRQQIRAALDDAGLSDLFIAMTDAPLDAVAASALRAQVGEAAGRLVSVIQPRIQALKALSLLDLVDQQEVLAGDLWRTLTRGVLSGQPPTDLLPDLAARLELSVPKTRTLYDTAVGVYSRQVEAITTEGDPEPVYLYWGPNDLVTRPFCREHVGKVYTRDEIDALDNGQLPNVFLTGGGYNCRHGWTAVSRFSELREYAGQDKRIPETPEFRQAA